MKSLRRKCSPKIAGYSLIEMMVTLAVGLILVSVALPTMIGAIQSYRLNSISQQIANLIDLTRYTAIRRNAVMSMQMTVSNGSTIFYVDTNGNGSLDPSEPISRFGVPLHRGIPQMDGTIITRPGITTE